MEEKDIYNEIAIKILKSCYKSKEDIFLDKQIRNIEEAKISLAMVIHTLQEKTINSEKDYKEAQEKIIDLVNNKWIMIDENTSLEVMLFKQTNEVKNLIHQILKS